jgi:alanyl-tRNA synthetase
LEERRAADREIEGMRASQQGAASKDLVRDVKEIAGIKVLAARVPGVGAKDLRAMVDDLRMKLESGIVLLASEEEGRVALALGVTKDLVGTHKAGTLIREVAAVVGGKGGGRPDFAQAGGNDPKKIDEAFEKLDALISGS